MTYIVNDKCIKCKLMDCVEVCPVDCFYEGKNMLVIKPDECIDCGVCEPECPVDAIKPETEEGSEKWLEINKKYSEIWPNISQKKEPPADNEKYKKVRDAYEEKGQELGVYVETITFNGKRYKQIRESKKKLNPRIFKENYDKIFRSLK